MVKPGGTFPMEKLSQTMQPYLTTVLETTLTFLLDVTVFGQRTSTEILMV